MWIHGTPPGRAWKDPPIQVHRHDPATVILRQSKDLHYEGPFVYLLLGARRALLLDTGATSDRARFPLRDVVDGLVDDWLADHPDPGYELVVGHTHGHSDHVAGDGQFADRPSTVVVAPDVASVTAFFGVNRGGEEATFDLGGRVLEVTAIPGHEESSIAVFDPATGFLLTGDTVYPGRLYVNDFDAFVASLRRLVAITEQRPVTAVMGCHVEMTATPGVDYPTGTTYQPDEAPLPMTVAQLRAVLDAATR